MGAEKSSEQIDEQALGSAVKYDIQNQLLTCLAIYMEDDIEGGHSNQDEMRSGEHDNSYLVFVIEKLSEPYKAWFESFQRGERKDGENRLYTAETLKSEYLGHPEKVLAELVAPMTVKQYLRNLEDLFKVRPAPEVPMVSTVMPIVRVEGVVDTTHDQVQNVIEDSPEKSA